MCQHVPQESIWRGKTLYSNVWFKPPIYVLQGLSRCFRSSMTYPIAVQKKLPATTTLL